MGTSGPPPRPGILLTEQQYEKSAKALQDGLASADVADKDRAMQTVLGILERAAKGEYD